MTDQNQSSLGPVIPEMPELNDQKPQKSGFAVASLVLGIAGFITCGITALIGLILGIIALVQMGKDKSLTGQKLAVAGVVISAIGVILMPIFILSAALFPVFSQARDKARATGCLSHVKQISMSMMMYSSDYNDTLPASGKWVEAISTYVPNKMVLRCPSARSLETCYAMNSKLNKIDIKKIKSPVDTAMIFESIPGNDPNGGKELLPSPGRHYRTNNIGFADGHVKRTRDEDLAFVKWDPSGK